jgi:hypothetical protein
MQAASLFAGQAAPCAEAPASGPKAIQIAKAAARIMPLSLNGSP